MGERDEAGAKLTIPSGSGSPRKSQATISELRKQRGNLKGRLTQFKKFVDSLLSVTPSKVQIAELKLRMQASTETFKNFNDIESQIELCSPETEISANSEYVETLEELYFGTMASANCLIDGVETNNATISSCDHTVNKPFSKFKLPEIKLPSFDGSYDRWLEFKHSYETMIHKHSDLDAIQKFHYLRSSLSGSALQVISALEFTAANYIQAWELLEIRFHNPRLLVHNHIKSLFNISALKQESSTQIRRLIDTVLRNLRALKTLEEPTDSWDTLIIHLIVSKLDTTTERKWESHIGSISDKSINNESKKLKLEDLLSFLRNRADTLEMINSNHSKAPTAVNTKPNYTSNKPTQVVSCVSASVNANKSKPFNNKRFRNCAMCNENHALYTCAKFLNLSVQDRLKLIQNKNLCNNCLREGHSLNECIFGPCKQCQQKHNSLLHMDNTRNDSVCVRPSSAPAHSAPLSVPSTSSCFVSADRAPMAECEGGAESTRFVPRQGLLPTALIEVADANNQFHTCRAFLDNGSEHCFITEELRNRLNVKNLQSTIQISGVAEIVTQTNQSCDVTIRSKQSDYSMSITCFVLPRITSSLPSTHIDLDSIRIPDNIQLADPDFNVPSEIDILIGSEIFWDLLDGEKIRLPTGPYLINSKLGWLVSGPINTRNLRINNQVHCYFTQSIDSQLRKFWEIEDIPQVDSILTADEQKCEDIFTNTTKREEDGRFSVRMPLRESADTLGDSYTLAKTRFLSLERKLERLPEYKRLYCDFMREYEKMGHMTRVTDYGTPNYFHPHHGIFREGSATTKMRVVYSGAAPTTTNKSLNSIQLPGPALQNDIFAILLRFRQYKYVACADVEKMFRQVLIQPDQRSLQMILWRENPTDPLHVYELNTVTYGQTSAPYLSQRCIRQLALECGDDVIARVINQDIFVDDLITGDDNFQNLLDICQKTYDVLQSGCFPLRKWTFNCDVTQEESKEHFVGEHTQNKTLGVGWDNKRDELYYTTKIDPLPNSSYLNKRMMLSIISQIYDPLGLLSPAVIISKILLQKLWLSRIDWDTPVPEDIKSMWNNFINTLSRLNDLRIPRHVSGVHTGHTELHIFSDASLHAYGACAYIRTYDEGSDVTVRLLCAKSKVSPLKSLTIPKLELSGALVAAKLYKKITDSLRLVFTKVYFWCDSTIVISWLGMSPHLLKPFVQNRVTQINELTGNATWFHVRSEDNPSDLLSRGVTLDNLIDCNLWWFGPSFLHDPKSDFVSDNTSKNTAIEDLPELRSTAVSLVCNQQDELFNFDRCSSYIKLIRIGAYVLRFILNSRTNSERKQLRQTGSLSVDELDASRRMLVRFAQMQSFPDVYDSLLKNKPIKTNCKQYNRISGLNVFLDDRNKFKVIRVGGRLCNSTSFDYNKKHPVLLCSKHKLTVLLFKYEHKRLLHAGPQLLLSTLRECCWPLGARNLARKIVRECVTCIRMKDPTDLSPLTPAHFLIGRPLTCPASEDLTDVQPSRLSRYARIEALRQHFWHRWAKEYVAELQRRTKWKTKKDDISLNSLVLIKDDNLPPLKWRLGRVTRLYPGSDGVNRVADILTATGTIRRSFSKICPLLPEPADHDG
ncbi:uncharacterized protein LOC133520879 [Cydia pomonella]|uniref:uncharacterized protein LOC133520879 n=1 Tax=Cydia pomonella TaxID=82600 RepID=UPI002ADD8B42|nr:uncharacterized protein LOC133520879 [Cydia pomonella]